MNFLAPLFLLGALAVALPVIFHLIRRTTRERTVFSSLMFLLPTPPRLTRRSRLEHLLLLLLRCIVLCLLAFGFARPFFKQDLPGNPVSGAAKRVVVLVDTSASMRRADLWAAARDKAEAIFRKASSADQIALFTFDRQMNPWMTFEQWNATPVGDRVAFARGRLADISPGWAGTHLDQALIRAADLLAETDDGSFVGPRQIVLISDFQEGSRMGALQAHEWPKGVELIPEPVTPRTASNAGLQLVADAANAAPSTSPVVRVRISNTPGSKREQFQVGWVRANDNRFIGPPTDAYVPPGQSRIVSLAAPTAGSAADRIVLKGDDEDFDNTVFIIPPETIRLNVLYLGNDAESDAREPFYFLQRAFQETPRQAVQLLRRASGTPLSPAEVQAANLFIVTDSLPEERARALHDQVAAGKILLCLLKNPAGEGSAADTLSRLLERDSIALDEGRPNNYAMLAEIDFHHPLFAPFADPRFSDFTKIHFWKYRRLDATAIPGARVIAKFDTGDPALVEVPVGKGRVLVLTSGWHPGDSQLALSTKFVPLLYSVLELSGGAPSAPASYYVGETVPLPAEVAANFGVGQASRLSAAVTLQQPDGKSLVLAAGETNFTQTQLPGIYRVNPGPAEKRFAVNLDAAESRTAPLPSDELERFGAPVLSRNPAPEPALVVGHTTRLQNTELEGRQKLWRWFILATLAVLLIETWLAGRTARRLPIPGGAPS